MLFLNTNKKKNHLVFFSAFFIVGGIFFLFSAEPAHAGVWNAIKDFVTVVTNPFETVFKTLLYGFFVLSSIIASLGFIILDWAIDPSHVTELFNNPAVYSLWMFIRDFFNLFFILILLYIAFTVVFQIQKNFKQALLSLVLAALLVNFSFPISRFLIDVTNVPMYFFANSLQDGSGAGDADAIAKILGTAKLQKILLPAYTNSESAVQGLHATPISSLLVAIVFMFIFGVTLLVLAVQFLIRLVALVVLVIFSSVGFAAAIIPGLKEYHDMWWQNFWKYALFGPAAMLMLVVSLRFLNEFSKQEASFQATAINSIAVEDVPTFVGMAMFPVTIIMLWMTLSLGQKFSIAGAAAVSGKGQAFAKWAGRKTYNNPVGRGLGGSAKKIAKEGKFLGMDYGSTRLGKFATGKYWASPSNTEATIKGGIVGWWGGGEKERAKIQQQAVLAKAKENKENQVNDSTLATQLDSKDVIERQAAALSLAENNGIRNTEVFSKAVAAVKDDKDMMLKVMDKAKPESVDSMDKAAYGDILKQGENALYKSNAKGEFEKDKDGNRVPTEALETLNNKLKKEGNIKVRVDYEIDQKVASGMDPAQARTAVYDKLIGKLSSDDLAKQGSIHSSLGTQDPALTEYLKGQAKDAAGFYQEAMKKMSKTDRDKWSGNAIVPGTGEVAVAKSEGIREKLKKVKQKNTQG